MMTREEAIAKFDNLELKDQYADYIMSHAIGDRIICNGDMLLRAMEDLYLFDDFINSISN